MDKKLVSMYDIDAWEVMLLTHSQA